MNMNNHKSIEIFYIHKWIKENSFICCLLRTIFVGILSSLRRIRADLALKWIESESCRAALTREITFSSEVYKAHEIEPA